MDYIFGIKLEKIYILRRKNEKDFIIDKPVTMSIPSIMWKKRREKRRCT